PPAPPAGRGRGVGQPVGDHLRRVRLAGRAEYLDRTAVGEADEQHDALQLPFGPGQALPGLAGAVPGRDPRGVSGRVPDIPPPGPADVAVRPGADAPPVAAGPVQHVVRAPGRTAPSAPAAPVQIVLRAPRRPEPGPVRDLVPAVPGRAEDLVRGQV